MEMGNIADESHLDILNVTLADRRVSSSARESAPAIDYIFVNSRAKEPVVSMKIDAAIDHNMLAMEFE